METNAELSKKVLMLETQIKTLKSENKSLTNRVSYLEELVKKLCEKQGIPMNINNLPPIIGPNKYSSNTKLLSNNIIINNNNSTNFSNTNISLNKKKLPSISQSINLNESKTTKDFVIEKEETWLYYILTPPKSTTEKILSLLNITDPDRTVLELSSNDFIDENGFYIKLLEKFESFNEYNQDFQNMEISQVISYFEEIFEVTLMSDTIIIIRDVPIKKNLNYDNFMVIIATFIERIHRIFNSVLQKENDNDGFGKMCLVLETQEEVNILNIVKNETRFLLSIEKLNT